MAQNINTFNALKLPDNSIYQVAIPEIQIATNQVDGLMSKEDKNKLNTYVLTSNSSAIDNISNENQALNIPLYDDSNNQSHISIRNLFDSFNIQNVSSTLLNYYTTFSINDNESDIIYRRIDTHVTENMIVVASSITPSNAQLDEWTITTYNGYYDIRGLKRANVPVIISICFGYATSLNSPNIQTNLGSETAANILSNQIRPGISGILSTTHGGTSANNRADAFTNLACLGENIITNSTNDTSLFWLNQKTGYTYITNNNYINRQPSQKGFLINYITGNSNLNNICQQWISQTGQHYYRASLNMATSDLLLGWTKLLDETDVATAAEWLLYKEELDNIDRNEFEFGFKDVGTQTHCYYKLPNGIMIQWGKVTDISFNGNQVSYQSYFNFGTPFRENTPVWVVGSPADSDDHRLVFRLGISANYHTCYWILSSYSGTTVPEVSNRQFTWVAIGFQ